MIQQSDSTAAATPVQAKQHTATHHQSGYRSPWDIIKTLPATATPWQQDSAIRANYKFPQVDWAHYHNPLRTPTTKPTGFGKMNLSKPLYYSHSLVQPDSIYRPEYATYRQGVAGDPVPYSIANDNLISSVLIACFVFALIAIAQSGGFIRRQFKNFFYTQREGTTEITETSGELRFQLFLLLQTCLLFSLVFFFYTGNYAGTSFTVPQYLTVGIYTGVLLLYFGVKALLYAVVNWIFFDKKKNEQWNKSMLFLSSIEGIALFPMVMLSVYFNLSLQTTIAYTAIVVILVKLLAFYKSYLIFFQKTSVFVQSFLYFCALELMPLGSLWGVLVLTDNYLKINFRQQKVSILSHTAIVFTSRHAIDFFFQLANELRLTIPEDMKYFCVTETISLYIQKYVQYRKRKVFFGNTGKIDDLIPVMMKHKQEKYLVPLSSVHNDDIKNKLDAKGLNHTECVMYRTLSNNFTPEEVKNFDCDMLIFSTPTGVNYLTQSFPNVKDGTLKLGAFGPATGKAIEKAGLPVSLMAGTKEYPSMVAALKAFLKKENGED